MRHTIGLGMRWLALWGGLVLLATMAGGQESTRPDRSDRPAGEVVVERDTDKQILRLKIPARGGRVAWGDVLEALMQAGHLDDQSLRDKFPKGSLDLKRSSSRYALTAANLVLAPEIRLQIVPASRDVQEHLLVIVDEAAALARRRQLTEKVRDRITARNPQAAATDVGLRLPAKWEETEVRQSLVLVVHGFNASPRRFEPLAQALRADGRLAGTYNYPDDQPIAASAAQLAGTLKEIATAQPQRRIALVAHSMGGLVCRLVIEDPRLDPGNVNRLIMIATPNQGSLLARVAFGLDLLDHAVPDAERSDVSRFLAAIEDGFSEAAVDLRPESVFLRELNARDRNPHVHYTLLLGTGGHFTRRQLDELREKLATAKSKSDVVGAFAPRIDETLADLDEVIRGLGDGAVAVKRGKLAGVEDTVILDFTHLGVLQQATVAKDDPLYKLVLERLKQ